MLSFINELFLSTLRPHLYLDTKKTRSDYNHLGRFVFLGVGIIALMGLLFLPDFENKAIVYGYTAYCYFHYIYNRFVSDGYALAFAIANIPLGLAMILSLQWLMPLNMVLLTVFLFPLVFVFVFTFHRQVFIFILLSLSIITSWGIAEVRGIPYMESYLITTFGATLLVGIVVRKAAEQTENLAHYDPLTGLMNRRYFTQRLNLLLLQMQRKNQPLSIVFIDLDDFKNINDTLGHAAGDNVLETVAQALKNQIKKHEFVARIGGDEFVIVMPNVAAIHAQTRVHSLEHELQLANIDFSAGLVEASTSDDVDSLLVSADNAMYAVKKQKKLEKQAEFSMA